MTTYYSTATWYGVIAGDILDLLKAQPSQVLLSIGSITIVASEAALMMPGPAAISVAVGAEWAYLRGIASSGRGSKGWVTALNWGALALVVLYGMLWGGRKFAAIPAQPDPWLAWLLVTIHIVPLAFVSLAAAAVHRSAVAAETTAQEQRAAEAAQRERDRLAWEEGMIRRQRETAAEIEAEKARRLMDVETRLQAKQLREQVSQASVTSVSQDTVTDAGQQGVTPRHGAENRDMLRGRVVTLIRDSQARGEKVNVSQAWQEVGLSSRGMWYKLENEAKARGEL